MNPHKKFKVTDIFIGIVFCLLFISLGVVITINFRPLYYLDVGLLHIEQESGYDKDEILRNYNALIDYSSPFFRGDLEFPTFPSSDNGLEHFKEVKNIFSFFYILGAVTLIGAVSIILYKSRKRDYHYLLVSTITSIVLPILVALPLIINFDTTFIVFHKLFFRNDYWMFDPSTDPVINILPSAFFMHCAFLIILFLLVGSLILFLFHLKLKDRSGIRYRMNKGLKL